MKGVIMMEELLLYLRILHGDVNTANEVKLFISQLLGRIEFGEFEEGITQVIDFLNMHEQTNLKVASFTEEMIALIKRGSFTDVNEDKMYGFIFC
ncbi:hypothetical protein [Paenibacillus campinasensis]|uniref:Uncharacterized protein n=1 Tax=Paenibacillus campinasensis TaxID=66347 RepID=A0A268EI80_9BACL|nr:hypothetical protein [Paenibacillus campinasensis]PAD72809.1 hypothetical protein CHH67_21105 [Paenibacillus campinasensis]